MDRILPLARELYTQYSARIPTAELNRWLETSAFSAPPAGRGGKTIKTFYMVQYETSPPRFKVMVNSRALVNKSSPTTWRTACVRTTSSGGSAGHRLRGQGGAVLVTHDVSC